MLSFSDRQSLLQFATSNKHSSFYRTLYGIPPTLDHLSITSHDEWLRLPLLTKEALSSVRMSERSFIPTRELDHIRSTSGTSGKPPLFCPRTHIENMEYRLAFHDFKKPLLAFTVPMMPHWHERFLREHGTHYGVISFDPRHPLASARLARAAGVDAVCLFVFQVPALGEALKAVGWNEHIKLVEIAGDTCSRTLYEYMRSTFPHATIIQTYGCSEIEDVHMGMPCKKMDGSEPLAVYHAKKSHYLELADIETGAYIEPEVGREGSLIISTFPTGTIAFPVIRYDIGDIARIVKTECGHGSWSFTLTGRRDQDFLKLPGGIITTSELQRVLRIFSDRITDEFELHRFDKDTESGPKPFLELRAEVRTSDIELLQQEISEALRVNPKRTYAQGVQDDMYMPLKIVSWKNPFGKKTKRMFIH